MHRARTLDLCHFPAVQDLAHRVKSSCKWGVRWVAPAYLSVTREFIYKLNSPLLWLAWHIFLQNILDEFAQKPSWKVRALHSALHYLITASPGPAQIPWSNHPFSTFTAMLWHSQILQSLLWTLINEITKGKHPKSEPPPPPSWRLYLLFAAASFFLSCIPSPVNTISH